MNEETNISSTAYLPAVFSVTLLSRFVCVYVCVQKKNTYTIRGPRGITTTRDGEGERESPEFLLSVLLLLIFLTRHYDRIYQRCRLKNIARWSLQSCAFARHFPSQWFRFFFLFFSSFSYFLTR